MLTSTYKIRKALDNIIKNSSILPSNISDALIGICDYQNPGWEADQSSKEYKFLQMLSKISSDSASLTVIYKFF